jgi:uncharacterized LabA/DUF88 family protein
MRIEPDVKRAVALIDGQNLFAAVKDAFGYTYPNYEVRALARAVCMDQGWNIVQTRFYTGIPNQEKDSFWHGFWSRKLTAMNKAQVRTYARELRYRTKLVNDEAGRQHTVELRQEKGVDMRMALDAIRLAHKNRYDVLLLFSQDQDFTEVAKEIRSIAQEQGRWIKVASAYPARHEPPYARGVDRTDWIAFERELYDRCIDRTDYGNPNGGNGNGNHGSTDDEVNGNRVDAPPANAFPGADD